MKREQLGERGAQIREALGLARGALEGAIGFDRFLDESIYGSVWARDALSQRERAICTLAALCALGRSGELPRWIEAALRSGLEARAIVEVFAQSGLYGGFGAAEDAIAVAARVFDAQNIEIPKDPPRDASLDELEARGQAFQADLHGEQSARGYADPNNPVTGALYGLATQFAYGELWVRPGLDRRERLLCALASFTVLGLDSQVRKFGVSALSAGLSEEQVIEVLVQTAPYGGFPRALNALAVFGDAIAS